MKESTRTKKVAKLIQKELSYIFQQDSKHLFGNMLITITDAKISPDFSEARIYLSFFPDNIQEKALEVLATEGKLIRKLLGLRIGKQLRIVPHLTYFLDTVSQEAQKMDALLNSLHIPPPTEEDPEVYGEEEKY